LVGETESGSASTIYGPVRAGLTTSQPTNKEAQLLELLKCLENRVEILESKYLEVLDTFLNVTARLAALSLSTINEIIIEEDKC
jgi:predicted house-cleaning noncanonical NTP pyrophosphatase (MazG superfamily)